MISWPDPKKSHTLSVNSVVVAIQEIHPKVILYSNVVKTHSSITLFTVDRSFCNFTQSTAVILPCSVQNCRRIHPLVKSISTNEFLHQIPTPIWLLFTHQCQVGDRGSGLNCWQTRFVQQKSYFFNIFLAPKPPAGHCMFVVNALCL